MSKAIVHLADVFVKKGYQGAPPVKFTANTPPGNPNYGTLNFKVNYKRSLGRDQGDKYEDFSVSLRGTKGDTALIGLLSAPGVKVALHGEITQEEYQGNKFLRVTCEGRNAVTITKYGDDSSQSAPREREVVQEAPNF